MDEPILFYEPEFYVFSNFSSFAVEWKGKSYMTVEHAYHSEKFLDESLKEQIRNQTSAHQAYMLAQELRKNNLRSDWDDVKYEIMKGIIRVKVEQHPYVQEKLLDSGNRTLIEDSPVDSFWGRGPDHVGQNSLGKIWMEVRDELRKGKIL